MKKGNGMKWLVFLSMALLLISTGCASKKNVAGSDADGLPQVSNFADDIKDITVPAELSWDRNWFHGHPDRVVSRRCFYIQWQGGVCVVEGLHGCLYESQQVAVGGRNRIKEYHACLCQTQ